MTKRGKDQGYTLVEMIVVIAIIAVVAGLSLISVTLIHSAKAKNASTTVDSEIATLITRSKNMQSDRAGWQYAARIYVDDGGVYYYQKGYYDPVTKSYDFENTDTEGEGKGTSLSSYVVVKYTSDHYYFVSYDSASKKWVEDPVGEGYTGTSIDNLELKNLNSNGATGNGGGLFIRFAKDGTCEAGTGDIRFYKRNGNIVAHEYIRANGSHQCR
ncbi:MAG: prepilin-type N-terminal cleavage/methylation domain-containing protein [Eubacterium sp.]|nr:prepilin-type N-terminal cleavage/methylation domain-containing protein [Eubacterium sp.]